MSSVGSKRELARDPVALFSSLPPTEGLGHGPKGAETRTLLLCSLIIGDRFIAPRHGRYSRKQVLERSLELLLA